MAHLIGIADPHLRDSIVMGASCFVGPQNQVQLGGDLNIGGSGDHGIEAAGELQFGKSNGCDTGRAVRNMGSDLGRLQNLVARQVVGVGIAGPLAGKDANAASGGYTLSRPFHQGFIQGDGGALLILEVQIGVFPARRERRPEVLFQIRFGDAVFFFEKLPFALHDPALFPNGQITIAFAR